MTGDLKKTFLIVGGAGLARMGHELIVHSLTNDVYLGPPPRIDINLTREPIIPDLDITPVREPKKRDWEQRQRKPRRK